MECLFHMDYGALGDRLHAMLKRTVEHQASDLYIRVGRPPVIRLEGDLLPLPMDPVLEEEAEGLTEILLSEKQRETFARKLEMNLVYDARESGRFRVNVHKEKGRIGLIFRRVLTKIPTIESLGLPPYVRKLALIERGLVLVSGPAGSGKTTTLAAMVECHNLNKAHHVITIEDPIEFLHESKKSLITQREVEIDTLSFHEALRNAVRQSPDVLLIGEMRDRESVEAAVFFAESGHLVLSSVHAASAALTIERVLNFFPQNQHHQICVLMAQHLRAIIAQRLVQARNLAGLVPVVEIMVNHARIAELLRKMEFSKIRETMAFLSGDGTTQTFDDHLLTLYQDGVIGLEEALRVSDTPNDLKLRIKALGRAPEEA